MTAAVNIFIFILLGFIALMLFVLLGLYLSTASGVKKDKQLKQHIEELVEKALSAKTKQEAAAMLQTQDILSRRSLAVLSEIYSGTPDKDKTRLRKILLRMDIEKRLVHLLDSNERSYLVELIRLVKKLDLSGLSDIIADVMIKHKDNINIQHEAFITLSSLSIREEIRQDS